jgi:hypothetical protein
MRQACLIGSSGLRDRLHRGCKAESDNRQQYFLTVLRGYAAMNAEFDASFWPGFLPICTWGQG